ncbi:hypothetical protein BU23DRAFT_641225, partial [Bimuria novae-zelandiae CBS 107.79]
YGMHSCVHSWTISMLNDRWDERLERLALTCVASEVPSTNADRWWILQQRLLQHAASHEHSITNGTADIVGLEWALHSLCNLYTDQGKLAEAEAMYSRALQGFEEALGPKHTSTLSAVSNLGSLYADQGKLAEAEAMYSRMLQGYEEALGPKVMPSYLPALDTMSNFGNLLSRTGRKDTAKILYTRALVKYTTI